MRKVLSTALVATVLALVPTALTSVAGAATISAYLSKTYPGTSCGSNSYRSLGTGFYANPNSWNSGWVFDREEQTEGSDTEKYYENGVTSYSESEECSGHKITYRLTPTSYAHRYLTQSRSCIPEVGGCYPPVNITSGWSPGAVFPQSSSELTSYAETGAQNAYITNLGSNTVSVIDTATNTVTATIPVGAEPRGPAVSPDGSTVYITNTVDGTVSVIDTATNTVIATIPVGSLPLGVAVTPDGSKVYVANLRSGTVSVIAAATNTVTATIPVGAEPNGVVLSPDGSTVYVANLRSGTVSVIDTASNTVVDTITDASFNNLIALGHL
jgi:YVTN family beta-propeller protein